MKKATFDVRTVTILDKKSTKTDAPDALVVKARTALKRRAQKGFELETATNIIARSKERSKKFSPLKNRLFVNET